MLIKVDPNKFLKYLLHEIAIIIFKYDWSALNWLPITLHYIKACETSSRTNYLSFLSRLSSVKWWTASVCWQFVSISFQSRKRKRLMERHKMAHSPRTARHPRTSGSRPERGIPCPENRNAPIRWHLESSPGGCCAITVSIVSVKFLYFKLQ